jgi:hypothetical protein
MAKVNMVGSDGAAFTTSLKNSRVHLANGTATLATAAKPAVAKNSYRTRALKAK